jgi:hypothetical protein
MKGIADPCPVAAPLDVPIFRETGPPGDAIIMPGRGTSFGEYIDLRDPEGTMLTGRLVERYDEVRPKQRKRHRDALSFRVRRVAANAMRGHFFRDPPAIRFYVKADAEQYEDKPKWMRHGALSVVVKALEDAGLVRRIGGKKMPHGYAQPSWTSSYWATDELIALALECGVTSASICITLPDEDLVQLFAPKPAPEYDRLKGELVLPRRGKRLSFEPTAETNEWTATLHAINAFYRQQHIGLGLATGELDRWLAEYNAEPDRKGAAFRLPELLATDLHRVFNNGNEAKPTFGEGGRLFGGWWMNAPAGLRRAITINGKPIVELDYSNCHPRMLYHQRGLAGDGELYRLPEIAAYEAETGVEPDTYRPCIKWLTQILINGKGRPEAVEPPQDMLFPPDIPVKQLVGLIEAMHQPIADAFRTGAGLGLMRIESDIALEIVATAMTEGWTVLSVHDSFITTIDQRDRLTAMMIDAYVLRLGKEPVIKE